MRIGLATWSSRRVGGVEDYLALLIPALRQAGLDPALWHETDLPHDRSVIDPLETVPHFNAGQLGVEASIEALRAWSPEVLYVQGLRDVETEARLLDVAPAVFFLHTYMGTCISGSKTFSRPVVEPCHRRFGSACLVQFFPRGCGGSSPITMWKLFRRESDRLRLLSRYKRILTHSQHMHDELAKHELRSDIVPFPIPRQAVSGDARDEHAWHLLFAGRMHYLKGGLLLLDALPKVAKLAQRPIRVTFAGDGPDRQLWQDTARRRVAESNGALSVEFPGWLSQDEIARLISCADLLVVPSVWPEPLGSVGPAAAQLGVPAAAFASGGITEWLADGISGHLAPANPPTAVGLAVAITRCLSDRAHYRTLSDGARAAAARFTMDRHIPALMSAFEQVSR